MFGSKRVMFIGADGLDLFSLPKDAARSSVSLSKADQERVSDSLFLIMEEIQNSTLLVNDVKQLIAHSREKVASTVNAEITLLYWLVGKRVNDEILQNTRLSMASK